MKPRVIIFCLLMSFCKIFAAESGEENFESVHNRVSFSGLLTSSDSYQLEASYHYMFNRSIGVGAAAGYWKVLYEDGWASGRDWEIESDDNAPSNIYLHPSLILKTPSLKIKNVGLGIYAEPGLMLNVPYKRVNIRQHRRGWEYDIRHISTMKGQWFAMDLRIGVYVNLGQLGFSAGYMVSNFNVYSQYRHLSYMGNSFSNYYPEKKSMQGGYLTASFYF